MATKTGWGMLNYTRSKDVADRQHRNYVSCLRAGYAHRAMWNAPLFGENGTENPKYRKAFNTWKGRFESIPSRDSAMQ